MQRGEHIGRNASIEVRERAAAALPMLLLLATTAMFFLCWFNRFAGIRSGVGELAGGLAILHGKIPYRDYFNPGPPLNALKAALLMKLFGRTLFALRLAAVFERLLLVALIYTWLCRLLPRTPSWIASLTTIILSAGDRTDPLSSYNHDAILFGILAAMCLDLLFCRIERTLRADARQRLLAMFAGIFTSLSGLTKQTVGAGCCVFFLCWILLALHRKPGVLWTVGGFFSIGLITPVLILATWLGKNHAFTAWVHMNLVEGPAAKAGSPLDFVYRAALVGYDNAGWVVLGAFLFALWIAPLLQFQRRPAPSVPTSLRPAAVALTLGVAVAIALSKTRLPTLHDQAKSAVYFTVFALLFLCWQLLRVKQTPGANLQARLLLFAGTGLATAAALSLSWPAFEAMLLPGLALPVALALTYAGRVSRRCIVALLVCAVYLQTREKLDVPFGFDYQDEAPVHAATVPSRLPLLRGELLPLSTVRFLDDTTRLVQSCTLQGETVFTYPEMGLIYALSGFTPPTVSPSHNIDVVNDTFAREEAARLLANPPRVLVYYSETETQQKGAERLWRHGRQAGQRQIVRAIEQLLPAYTLVRTHQLREGDPRIGVYLRNRGEPRAASCR